MVPSFLKVTIWAACGVLPSAGGEPPVRRGVGHDHSRPGASLSPQPAACTVPPVVVRGAAGDGVGLDELLPHLRGVVVEKIECTAAATEITARWWPARAACPVCGTWSSRVHSKYVRRLQDTPVGGRPVLIRLAMRRFICQDTDCEAVTFAGQAAGLTARYQRRSVPLTRLLSQIALELAGRAGTRVTAAMGVTVHRSTLLRLVIALPEPEIRAAPEILGVDDFALRRGHVYGTILVDAGTGRVIDMLPGRDAGPLADWLRVHPGARVSCRDRAGAYAEGARDGAPAAVQVADRWHLWHNLAGWTVQAVARHRACLKQITAAGSPEPQTGPAAVPVPAAESRLAVRMREQHAAARNLRDEGAGLRAIARALGLDRKTARRFAQAATADDAVARTVSRTRAPGPLPATRQPSAERGLPRCRRAACRDHPARLPRQPPHHLPLPATAAHRRSRGIRRHAAAEDRRGRQPAAAPDQRPGQP
jgi:Transposase/zinc-finger of transposase IS204/IS1001/IS1096/IS1165